MFKNMKIRKKLIIAFIAICMISISSGIVGIILLNITTNQYSNALINYGFSQGYIGKFSTLLNHEGNLLRDLVSCQSKVTFEGVETQLNQTIQETNSLLATFKKSSEESNSERNYQNIASLYRNYSDQRDEAIKFAKNGQAAAAQVVINNKISIPMNMCNTSANDLIEKNRVDGLACSEKLNKLSKMASVLMILVMLFSLLAAVLISIIISKRISKPVVHIKNVAEKLCNGNLNVSIDYNSNNEIGLMAKSFATTIDTLKSYILEISTILNSMAEGNLDVTCAQEYKGDFAAIKISLQKIIGSLNQTFTNINQSAEQVTAGSEQVASGAQSLAQGAAEQASSIEQLSATINDIADKVNLTAEHAEHTNHQIVDVGKAIEASNEDMQNMLTAMSNISDSSQQIARIIKAIEDIAFQTNILALNAAVEAARAGSAGKGFAVVAEEVRNLASKSSQAAKNTTELIENSMFAVDKGTKIANQTAQSLSCVVKSAEKAIQLIDEINIACKNESESISQVTRGVDQIAAVVQTNSATAEQSAAASDQLSKLATGLKSDVVKFTLSNQTSSQQNTDFDDEQSGEYSSEHQNNFAYK